MSTGDLLELVGYVALGFLSHAFWMRVGDPLGHDDSFVDQMYRVRNAAQSSGNRNLPIPVRPRWWALPICTLVVVGLLLWWLGASSSGLDDLLRKTIVVALPAIIGSLIATLKLRYAFIERWRNRRADPDDRVTREFGAIPE